MATSSCFRRSASFRPASARIALHHLADLSVEQVADTLGLPTGTVKARLSRGRAALSTLLVEEGPHV
jgi:RNA polymerase sigma-70 factor (ECF subfamily)